MIELELARRGILSEAAVDAGRVSKGPSRRHGDRLIYQRTRHEWSEVQTYNAVFPIKDAALVINESLPMGSNAKRQR